MPRSKKDAKILNVKLDREVHEQLEQFCEETGMPKTAVVEKVLDRFLKEYFNRPENERRII